MMRVLFSLLLAVTLTGCDSLGSDDSAPDWVGDWKLTESFGGDAPIQEIYFTYSEERLTTYVADLGSGCDIFTREVVEIDGNDIRLEIGTSGLETQRLTVSDGDLTITVIRSNDSNLEGQTLKATSVDTSPREILGCQSSTDAKEASPPFRQQ